MLQKEEGRRGASKACTAGGSSGLRPPVRHAEDDHIILLDPSSPPVPERICHSWMAIAEGDLIELIDPSMPDNADHILPLDDIATSRLDYLIFTSRGTHSCPHGESPVEDVDRKMAHRLRCIPDHVL